MKKILYVLFVCLFIFTFGCNNNTGTGGKDKASLEIGDKGPGGGTVFHKEGDKVWEVSDKLGEANWENAKTMCKNHRGGGLSDWYLPSEEELNWVYENLVKTGKVQDTAGYWSSSPVSDSEDYAWAQYFDHGDQAYDHKGLRDSVRAVRAF